MVDVVALQKERIEMLESVQKDLYKEIGDKIEIIANLSTVLAYLTDDEFKEFAKKNNWSRVIVDYLEKD